MLASGLLAFGVNAHIIVTLYDPDNGGLERGIVDFYDASDMSFSSDGGMLAVTNGYVFVYTTGSIPRFAGNMLERDESPPSWILKPSAEDDYVVAAEFSPLQPSVVLSTAHGMLLAWTIGESDPRASIATLDSCPSDLPGEDRDIAFSRDGAFLATNLCDHELAVYDSATLSLTSSISVPSAVRTVAFSPDGLRVVAGYRAGGLVWDLASGSVACVLDTNGESPDAIGFSQDEERILVVTEQGSVAMWQAINCGGP